MKNKSHNNIHTIIKNKNKYNEKNHEKRRRKKNITLM